MRAWKFIRSLATPFPLRAEDWALEAANLTSPDEIIAASIIQSMAKNFKDWKCDGYGEYWRPTNTGRELSNNDPVLKYTVVKDGPYSFSQIIESKTKGPITINGTPLDRKAGARIVSAYCDLRTKHEAAEAAAAEALKTMKENEKKWNLAEKLTGMKRNNQGALVPIKEIV